MKRNYRIFAKKMGTISRKFLDWFVTQGGVSKAYANKARMLLNLCP
jgi:hypothetical protein